MLGLAFAAGIALGLRLTSISVWFWLAAAVGLLLSAIAIRRASGAGLLCFLLGVASFGAAWVTLHHQLIRSDDLAALVSDEPMIFRVQGEVSRAPELRDRSAGSLGIYDYRPPATLFPMRVEAMIDRLGRATPVRGQVLVRVEGMIEPLRVGDRIEAAGTLRAPGSPHNPGDFDYRAYARSLGQAGVLAVESRELIRSEEPPRRAWLDSILNVRDSIRRRAGGWIKVDLDSHGRTERESLLAALLLGVRDPDLDRLNEAFRRVGVSHLLAISGLHLAILAGLVLMVVRAGGWQPRWQGVLVIGIVVAYLMLVQVRTPVIRAGVMSVVASVGVVRGRRIRASGLVAFSAIGILVWWPEQILNPGFQLTFGVVLGLIYLVPIVRLQWFGPHDALAGSTAKMLMERSKTALVAAAVSWLVATPLQMFHFGTISPLCVPLTLLCVPLVTLVLALGYAKMILAVILPSASGLLAAPLGAVAGFLIGVVQFGDQLPGAVIASPCVSWGWVVAAELCIVGLILSRSLMHRRIARVVTIAIILWAIWPLFGFGRPAFRIDMLSVNDGSCYLVRGGSATVVFDAGASPDLDAGRRSIVPAMRQLGVRSIDAIIISHANLDHYSSVLELIDAFGADEVIVTVQFMEAAGADPLGSAAALLRALKTRGISLTNASRGDERAFGSLRCRWLHPGNGESFDRTNDESQVIRIESPAGSAMFCGDIQRDAIDLVLQHEPDVQADVIELPHHGSFNEAAVALVRRVQPRVVLQSTGERRLDHDRWPSALGSARRLITARHGACWVEIDSDGAISTGTYLDGE